LIVVDTNIIAYLLIEGDRTDRVRSLWRDEPDWRVPPLWRHEFLNVLATFAKRGGADLADTTQLWGRAVDTIGSCEIEVDMSAALEVAVTTQISAYDAQFITLARRLGVPLVTEDKKLRKTFPDLTMPLP
jgi:predicted nucleic acid-binding protein